MLLEISQVLNSATLAIVKDKLADADFQDGKLSAGIGARNQKTNQEIAAADPVLQELNQLVMGSLVRHPQFQRAALPLKTALPIYARYQPGMAYGLHTDNAIMGGEAKYRSDVSLTVFLNSPEDYEGGELELATEYGQQTFKLNAGDALLYPSSSLHQVREVTSGERLVAVTWVQSMIRSAEQRKVLYQIDQVREPLLRDAAETSQAKDLDAAYNNLFRMWADV